MLAGRRPLPRVSQGRWLPSGTKPLFSSPLGIPIGYLSSYMSTAFSLGEEAVFLPTGLFMDDAVVSMTKEDDVLPTSFSHLLTGTGIYFNNLWPLKRGSTQVGSRHKLILGTGRLPPCV